MTNSAVEDEDKVNWRQREWEEKEEEKHSRSDILAYNCYSWKYFNMS